MAWALLATEIAACAAGGDTFSGVGIDATGGNFITAIITSLSSATAPVISDDESNTYEEVVTQEFSAVGIRVSLWIAKSATVSASLVPTLTGTDFFGGVIFSAWSGGAGSSPVDDFDSTTNGAGTFAETSPSGVGIDPTEDDDLIICGASFSTNFDTSFIVTTPSFTTLGAHDGVPGASIGFYGAYRILATAANIDPLLDWSGAGASASAAFVAALKTGGADDGTRFWGSFVDWQP